MMMLCAITVLVGCGDPYRNMTFSLSETSIDLYLSDDSNKEEGATDGENPTNQEDTVENKLDTRDVVATISGAGKGVSNEISVSFEGDNCVDYTAKVDGYKTTYTFTAKSLGSAKFKFLTEGNRSQILYINVYEKIDSIEFASDALAIPNGGQINLADRLVFTAGDKVITSDYINESDVVYQFVDKRGNVLNSGYSYMSLSNTGVLSMTQKIDLSSINGGYVDGTNIPYDNTNEYPYPCVYVRVISKADETVSSSIKAIYLVDVVSPSDVVIMANNLTEEDAMVGKDSSGVWTVVLANNNSDLPQVLYDRNLSFVFDEDEDLNRRYNVELVDAQSYRDDGKNNPVAFVEPMGETNDFASWRVYTNKAGTQNLIFNVTYKDFENVLNFDIGVKIVVKTFPESIKATSDGTQLSLVGDEGEVHELNVLNLLEGETAYQKTPLRITTDVENNNVTDKIYFTIDFDYDENVNEEIKGKIFVTDVSGNVITSTTPVYNGSQLYIYHSISGEMVPLVAHDAIRLKVTVNYDLNPSANPSSNDDEDYKYLMSYEKMIPLAIYNDVSDYGAPSSLYINISEQGNEPVTLLDPSLGVEVTNFSIVTLTPGAEISSSVKDGDIVTYKVSLYDVELYSVVFDNMKIYVMSNIEGNTGEVIIQIHDPIRNKNIISNIVIYSPLIGVYTDITNESQYKGYLLKSEYTSETGTLETDKYISALHLSINKSSNISNPENIGLPINVYNLVSVAGGISERKIVSANDVSVKIYEWNEAAGGYVISHSYMTWNNGKLYTYDRSYTNTEHPLKVEITVKGYSVDEEDKISVATKSREMYVNIYEVIHDFEVSTSNNTIYDKSSLGYFDYDKAQAVFTFKYDAKYYDESSIEKVYTIANYDEIVLSKDVNDSESPTGFRTVNVRIHDLVMLFDNDNQEVMDNLYTLTEQEQNTMSGSNISVLADWKEVARLKYGTNLISPIEQIVQSTTLSYDDVLAQIFANPIFVELNISIKQYKDTDMCETLWQNYSLVIDYATKVDNIVTNIDADGVYLEIRTGQANGSAQVTFETYPVNAFNSKLVVYSSPAFVTLSGLDGDVIANNVLSISALRAGEGYIVVASMDSYNGNNTPTLTKRIKIVVADGSKQNPFHIANTQQFLNIANDYVQETIDGIPTKINKNYYVLTSNIVLTKTYDSSLFDGVFAGGINGLYEYELLDENYKEQYTISGFNLVVNNATSDTVTNKYYGLFEHLAGNLNNVVIKNSSINITENEDSQVAIMYVGMFAGDLINVGGYQGSITSDNGLTNVQGTINIDRSKNDSATTFVGGYVGNMIGTFVNINNSSTSSTNVDLSVSYNANGSDIANATSVAIGGVTGSITGGNAPSTYDYQSSIYGVNIGGSITSNAGSIGGVVGISNQATISFATSQMVVLGGNYVGGLVGYLNESDLEYSKVEFVSLNESLKNTINALGGLVGYSENSGISYSYARQYNSANSNLYSNIPDVAIGGIVGIANNTTIFGSYFDGNIKKADGVVNYIGSIIGKDHDTDLSMIQNSFAYGDIDSENKFVSNRDVTSTSAIDQQLNYGVDPNGGDFVATITTSEDTVTDQVIYVDGFRIQVASGTRVSYDGISQVTFTTIVDNDITYNVGKIIVDGEEIVVIDQDKDDDDIDISTYTVSYGYTICDASGNEIASLPTTYDELKNQTVYVKHSYEYSKYVTDVSAKYIENIDSSYIVNPQTDKTAVVKYNAAEESYNLNDSLRVSDLTNLNLDNTYNRSVFKQMNYNIYSVNGDFAEFETTDLLNTLNTTNGKYYDWLHFVTSGGTTINHNLPIIAYPVNSDGLPSQNDIVDMKILYNLVPTEITVTMSDSDINVNNPYFVVENGETNRLVLTYNERLGLFEKSDNNTYTIGLVTDGENDISYAVATQDNLAAFDIDTRVKIYSSNASVVEVVSSNAGYNIRTNGLGRATLTIQAMLDPNVKVDVDILVVRNIRELVIYDGKHNEAVGGSFTEFVGDTNTYSLESLNYYNFQDLITYEYVSNQNIGYVVKVDSVSSAAKMNFANTLLDESKVGSYFVVNSLDEVKVSALSAGDNAFGAVELTIIPFIKLESEYSDFVLDKQNYGANGIVIDGLAKAYTFNLYNKAHDLTLPKNKASITPNTPATFSVSFITSAIKDGQLKDEEGLLVTVDGITNEVVAGTTIITNNDYIYLTMVGNYEIVAIPSNDKEYIVQYNFSVRFNGDVYRYGQDYIRGGDYSFVFGTKSNSELAQEFVLTLNLISIENIYTHFYPSAKQNASQNGELNPTEAESNYIVPGRNGLLKINVTPELSNVDYLIVTVDPEYAQYVLFTQYYARIDDEGNISAYEYYADGPEIGSELVIRRVSNFDSQRYSYDGNYYVNMLLNTDAPVNITLHISITAYVDGQSVTSIVMPLDTKPMPEIKATIDNTHESILAAGQRKEISIETVETDSISYDIYEYYTNASGQQVRRSFKDSSSNLYNNIDIVEEGGKYYLTSTSDVYGYKYYVEFTASKMYNGIRETAVDTIEMQTVQYEIKNLNVSGVENGQATMKNAATFVLDASLDVVYSETLANKVSSNVKTLQNIFNGINDYVINGSTLVYYTNTWNYITRSGSETISYPFVDGVAQFNSTITYYGASNARKTNAYIVARKVTGTTNIPQILCEVKYYYNESGLPVAYNNTDEYVLNNNPIIYTLQVSFSLTILENSTYDHPNPIYNADGLREMNNQEAHYILVNDITLENWSPLDAQFMTFDGNGYVITIKSFDLTGFDVGSDVALGIFQEIYEGSVVKNVTVDISNLLVSDTQSASIDLSRYGNVSFGIIAPTNSGTITNAKIVNRNRDNQYLNILTNASGRHNIGGIVAVNAASGSITNSYVGVVDNINASGDTLVKNNAINTATDQGTNISQGENTSATINIYPFVLAGANNIAGIVTTNNGTISTTYVNKVGIINTSKISDNNNTAGFVVNNNGHIFESFIQGDGVDNSTTFRANNTYYIESKGNFGAFVHTNSGSISNSYASINVKTNSGKTAGFVYDNNGTISYCYTTSKSIGFESAGSDVQGSHGPFTGIDSTGAFQSSEESYTGCYYVVVGDEQANANEIADPIYTSRRAILGSDATIEEINAKLKEIDNTYSGTSVASAISKVNELNNLTDDATMADVIAEMNRKGITGEQSVIDTNASESEVKEILGLSVSASFADIIASVNTLNNLGNNSSTVAVVSEINYVVDKLGLSNSSLTTNPFLYVGSYNGFSMSTGVDTNYVWIMSSTGPKLSSCSYIPETYSFRYIDNSTSSADTGFNYTYHQNTAYGSESNPLLVSTGEELIRFVLDNTNVITINGEKLYVFGATSISNTNGVNAVTNIRLVNNFELNDLANIKYSYGQLKDVYLREIIFAGVFDGNGMTISNINLKDSIVSQSKVLYGLFGQVGLTDKMKESYKATTIVKNVNMVVNGVESSAIYTGTLAGAVYNATLIDISINGVSSSALVKGEKVVGGLAGIITGDTRLKNINVGVSASSAYSSSQTTVDPTNYEFGSNIYAPVLDSLGRVVTNNIGYVGGIAGIIDVDNLLSDSLKTVANVKSSVWDSIEDSLSESSTTNILSSAATDGSVRDLTVSGAITLSGENVGGLFGYVGANTRVKNANFVLESINQSLMARNISGVIVAQLYGILERASVDVVYEDRIANDTKLPSVVGSTTLFDNGTNYATIMGGLVGYMKDAAILDSYTKANVINERSTVAGGIVGKVEGNGYLSRVYTTGYVLSSTVTGGAIGLVKRTQYDSSDGTQKVYSDLYLDYVVAANTWDDNDSKIQKKLNSNYKSLYTYTVDSTNNTTNTGTLVYRLPEIGNQGMIVPRYVVSVMEANSVYKYILLDNATGTTQNATISGSVLTAGGQSYTIDPNTFTVSKNGVVETCQVSAGTSATFNYVGSLIGRYNLTNVDINGKVMTNLGTYLVSDYDNSKSAEENGVKTRTYDNGSSALQYLNTVYSTTLKDAKISDEDSEYSKNIVSTIDSSANSYSEKQTKIGDYFSFENAIGWQRKYATLIGENPDEGALIDGGERQQLVKTSVFFDWQFTDIVNKSADTLSKDWIISNDTNLPEFTDGTDTSFKTISSLADFEKYIIAADSTKNKYYTISGDIGSENAPDDLNKEVWLESFEGILIGANNPNSADNRYTIYIHDAQLFANINTATIMNLNFVFVLSENPSLTMSKIEGTQEFARGLFANAIYSTSIENCSIKIINKTGSDTLTFNLTNNISNGDTLPTRYYSSDTGVFVGYMSDTHNTAFDISIDSSVVWASNNIGLAQNMGLFGRLVGSNISDSQIIAPSDASISYSLGYDYSHYSEGTTKVKQVNLGGFVGKIVNTNLSRIGGTISVVGSNLNDVVGNYTSITTMGLVAYATNSSIILTNQNNTNIDISLNDANSIDTAYVGKVIGYAVNSDLDVSTYDGNVFRDDGNVEFTGEINIAGIKTQYVGGIAGYLESTDIYSVESSGNINIDTQSLASSVVVGGIVGYANNALGTNSIIQSVIAGKDNSSTINIEGTARVNLTAGGVIGNANAYNLNLVTNNNTIIFDNDVEPNSISIGGIVGNITNVNIENFASYKDIIIPSAVFAAARNNRASVALAGIVAKNSGSIALGLVNGFTVTRIYQDMGNYNEYLFANDRVKADLAIGELSSNCANVVTVLEFYRNEINNIENTGSKLDYLSGTTAKASTRLKDLMNSIKDYELYNADYIDFVVKVVSSDQTISTSYDYIVINRSDVTLTFADGLIFSGIVVANDGENDISSTITSSGSFTNYGVIEGVLFEKTSGAVISNNYGVLYNVAAVSVDGGSIASLVDTNNYQMIKCAMINNSGIPMVKTNNGSIYDSYAIVSMLNASNANSGFVETNNGIIYRSYFAGNVLDIKTNNKGAIIQKSVSDKTATTFTNKFTSKQYSDFISSDNNIEVLTTIGDAFTFNTNVGNSYGYPLIVGGIKLPTIQIVSGVSYYNVYNESQWNSLATLHSSVGYVVKIFNNLDFANKTFVAINNLNGSIETNSGIKDISNLTYKDGYLIGELSGKVSNLNITISQLSGTSFGNVGGIAGKMTNNSSVTNCSVVFTSAKTLSAETFGGIVGTMTGGTITNSKVTFDNNITLQTIKYAGGLVGSMKNSTINITLGGNIVTGTIKAATSSNNESAVGGLVGYLDNSTISGATFNVTVNVYGINNVGGVIGYAKDMTVSVTLSHNGTIGKYSNSSNGAYMGGVIGYYNNQGQSISAMHNGNITGNNYVGGLFGFVSNRLILSNGTVGSTSASITISGNNYVGGVVGYASYITITNANTYISSVKGTDYVGGFIGYVLDSLSLSTINDNSTKATITGNEYVGGVIGEIVASDIIVSNDITNNNVVSGENYIGGFAGDIFMSSYSDYANMNVEIRNVANISGSGNEIGGIVGKYRNQGTSTIGDLYNTGSVTGNIDVGGIFGYAGSSLRANSYSNTASIKGSSYVGGIIGYAYNVDTITTITNSGNISGETFVGGLFGRSVLSVSSTSTISNSGDVTGNSKVGGISGEVYSMINYPNTTYKNTGDISGNDNVGGIIGYLSNSTNVYSKFDVRNCTIEANSYAGGVIGGANSSKLSVSTDSKFVISNVNILYDFDDYRQGHGDDPTVKGLFSSNLKSSKIAGNSGTLKKYGYSGTWQIKGTDPTWYGTRGDYLYGDWGYVFNDPLYAKDSGTAYIYTFFGNMPNMSGYSANTSGLTHLLSRNNIAQENVLGQIKVGLVFGVGVNGSLSGNAQIYSSKIQDMNEPDEPIFVDSFAKTFYSHYNEFWSTNDYLGAMVIEFVRKFDDQTLFPSNKSIEWSDIADIYVAMNIRNDTSTLTDDGSLTFNLSAIYKIFDNRKYSVMTTILKDFANVNSCKNLLKNTDNFQRVN